MRAFKLWLEPDENFPRFKRLRYSIDEVPLADILLKGVHPWDHGSRLDSLCEKTIQILNGDNLLLPELKEFGYCPTFSSSYSNEYCRDKNIFERLLDHISNGVFFVDDLKYMELVSIAKNALMDDWSSEIVYSLISKICGDFNSIRDFLKKKDKSMALSGYNDINKYNLAEIFKLEDFDGEDKIIIEQALPTLMFRSSRFINNITDDRGFLRLTDSISHFQMRLGGGYPEGHNQMILYNCHRKNERIKLYPVMNHYPAMRAQAKKIAQAWRMDKGRYCFTVDIDRVEEMISEGRFQILFPELNYQEDDEPQNSYAQLSEKGVPRFTIGRFIKAGSSGETLKSILQKHGISMTGRKEELLEKLAKLAANIYQHKTRELDAYFTKNLFIKMDGDGAREVSSFPVPEEFDLKNMILAMYVVKHLRGNTILDASHCNDTFDLVSLARALIKGEVAVDGSFVRVTRNHRKSLTD